MSAIGERGPFACAFGQTRENSDSIQRLRVALEEGSTEEMWLPDWGMMLGTEEFWTAMQIVAFKL